MVATIGLTGLRPNPPRASAIASSRSCARRPARIVGSWSGVDRRIRRLHREELHRQARRNVGKGLDLGEVPLDDPRDVRRTRDLGDDGFADRDRSRRHQPFHLCFADVPPGQATTRGVHHSIGVLPGRSRALLEAIAQSDCCEQLFLGCDQLGEPSALKEKLPSMAP